MGAVSVRRGTTEASRITARFQPDCHSAKQGYCSRGRRGLVLSARDLSTLRADTIRLRTFNSPDSDPIGRYPGPATVASLGVDNIAATAAASVPEPGAAALLLLGLGALGGAMRRRDHSLQIARRGRARISAF
jgi:hypothetical protein